MSVWLIKRIGSCNFLCVTQRSNKRRAHHSQVNWFRQIRLIGTLMIGIPIKETLQCASTGFSSGNVRMHSFDTDPENALASYFLYVFLSLFHLYSDSSGRFQQCAELDRVCLLPSSSGGDYGVPAAWSDAPSPAAPTANAPRTACMYNKSYSKSQRHL